MIRCRDIIRFINQTRSSQPRMTAVCWDLASECTIVDNFLAGRIGDRNQNIGVTELHTFSTNTTNEFRASLSRTYSNYASSDGGQDIANQIGMPNVNVSPYTTGLPWVLHFPFANLDGGHPPFVPSIIGYTSYQFTDNLSHVVGKHFLKMGFDMRRRLNNQLSSARANTYSYHCSQATPTETF